MQTITETLQAIETETTTWAIDPDTDAINITINGEWAATLETFTNHTTWITSTNTGSSRTFEQAVTNALNNQP